MQTKSNSTFNTYLSTCDLINKYLLKNVKKVPNLDKVVIEFSLNDNLKFINNTNEINTSIKLKTFFLLYSFFSFLPYIKIIKKKNLKKKKNSVKINISLKIVLNQKYKINTFLFLLFYDIWNKTLLENYNIFNSINKCLSCHRLDHNKFIYKTFINCYFFNNLNLLFNNFFSCIDVKSIKFKINFVFANLMPGIVSYNNIKNLQFFWIV
jgi:hypothetical protein